MMRIIGVNKRLLLGLISVFMIAAGCSPEEQVTAPLPTLASLPSPTPPTFTLDTAERTARYFLEAWRENDFENMHSLITFASQEATPLADFASLYQSSHDTLTLQNLAYQITSQLRDTSTMVIFNYDVMFETRLLGEFSDNNRTLRLVYDAQRSEWRVAWSPADIFVAMGRGGRLRLEPRIPSRANIYDHDGNILADQNGRVVTVSVVKGSIPVYDRCLSGLSLAMNKPMEDIQALLDARAANWVAEVGTVEPIKYVEMHEQLERDCAAQFRDRPTRRYSNGTLAPNILGYVGYPDEADIPTVEAAGFTQDSILGRSGIEASWDETLRGQAGGRLLVVEPNGDQTVLTESASKPSESLWLTLDSDLQAFIAQAFERAYAQNAWSSGSKGASAVIMDVHTGAVLAMVSYPAFDNNAFNPFPSMGRAAADAIVTQVQNDPRRPQLNRPTLGIYPAGSIFKIVDAIAVADSGVYVLDERYACSGIWTRDIRRFDWLAGGHGTLTLPQGLMHSCNPYFYEVGYQMDQTDPFLLPNYARRLGLGNVTGLRDLPESAGNIPDPDWLLERGFNWTFSEAVNMAIGQGYVDITPLQFTRLVAGVANGGTLYRPQLVEKVGILGETPSYTLTPDPMETTGIRIEVMDMVRGAMCNVTSVQGGTAEHIFRHSPLQDLVVCGKTGTAQATGDVLPHAWFTAFAPRDNPQIAITVMIENAGEGSAVAAPIVRQILEYYFFGTPLS
jgi:penicillin-binding protein 2